LELSFVGGALRRYWWIVLVTAILGAVPGLIARHEAVGKYEATSELLISPPSQTATQVSNSNDPDRYVIGQLSVLNSSELAEQVAAKIGNGQDAGSIAQAVTISHVPKTDIVQVKAATTTPELSQKIANAYAEAYIAKLQAQVSQVDQPQVQALDTQLNDLLTKLTAVNQQIAAAMAPYLDAKPVSATSGYPPIPDEATVVPELVTQRETMLSQYNQLLQTKTQLQLNNQLQVNSQIVQQASSPTQLSLPRSSLYVVIGFVAGAFVGAVSAVLLARVGSRAVNADQVGEELGFPVVGRMPKLNNLKNDKRHALEALEPHASHFVDNLCVRTEARVRHGRAATILVVGTQRSSGATTLASALAARFGTGGSEVLLVDTNVRRPELTVLYAQAGQTGLPGLLGVESGESVPAEVFSATNTRNVRVVGVGPRGDAPPIRRQTVPHLIDVATSQAQVVIVDGGPLLDAAANARLAEMVDAIVLTIPIDRQKLRDLEVISRQLQGVAGEVLPVLAPASRPRRRRAPARPPSAGPAGAIPTTAVEVPGQPGPTSKVTAPKPPAPAPPAPTPTRR
jgi:capsular polysaccharide biosynthesis protein